MIRATLFLAAILMCSTVRAQPPPGGGVYIERWQPVYQPAQIIVRPKRLVAVPRYGLFGGFRGYRLRVLRGSVSVRPLSLGERSR